MKSTLDGNINVTHLKEKTIHGLTLLIGREFAAKCIIFLGQLILFRIISPALFGTYAILIFIVGFFDLFSDIGLNPAIIQKNETLTKLEISSLYLLKQFFSIILVGMLYVFSPLIIHIYPHLSEQNILMVRVLSLYLLIKPLRTIYISLLEREINYLAVSTIEIVGIFVYQVVVVICALYNLSVWSFIYAILAKEITELIISYFYKPFLPSLIFSFKKVRSFLQFGIFIQGQGIVTFIHNSLSPLIVGTKINPQAVGYNDFASNIASFPQSVTDNFGRVAFASFSRIQNNLKLLSLSIEKSISILSIFTFLFLTFIIGFGEILIRTIFTDKWALAISPLYWFAFSTFFVAAMSAIGQGLLVLGKSKEIFYISTITTIFELLLAYWFVLFFGYVGIAIAAAIVAVFAFILYYFLSKKMFLSINIVSILFPRILVATITLGYVFMLNIFLANNIVFLLFKLLTSFSLYVCLTFLFSPKELKEIFIIGRKILKI